MKLPKWLYQFSFQREPLWMLVFTIGPALIGFVALFLYRLTR